MRRHRLIAAASVATVVCLLPSAAGSQQPQERPRPVFRAGALFVRVDVYPTQKGGPIAGLKAEDFELLEDGKPQAIETFETIASPMFTPNADRRDPNSQREGFELARDPQYRVFVLYLDAYHVSFSGSSRTRLAISEFLNRMVGPRDLFGVLTPAQTINDLLLGQLTQTIDQQLTDHPTWGIADRYEPQPGEVELEAAFPQNRALVARLIALRRLDKVYSDLEALVGRLGDLRDERKNILFFSDFLASPGTNFSDLSIDPLGRTGAPPPVGVTSEGKLTLGPRNSADPDRRWAETERARLTSIDFAQRFRDLLRSARQANVSFYTIRPGGLDPGYSMLAEGISNLHVLAEQTDGQPVAASNDIRAGLRKVADDLSAHYVLGYYSSNTTWNGASRQITVKLKSTGEKLRARREYRAPTEAEMTSLNNVVAKNASAPAAPSAAVSALDALARLRPAARMNAYGVATAKGIAIVAELAAAEIEGGRWKQGAEVQVMLSTAKGDTLSGKGRIEPGARGTLLTIPAAPATGPWEATVRVRSETDAPEMDTVSIAPGRGTLLGDPVAYRAGAPAASPWRPLAAFHFRRTERVRIEWPMLTAVESYDARLLDRKEQPLQVPVTIAARDGEMRMLVADLNLAPLSIGDYLIEVTAKGSGAGERKLVAIRVSNAR